MSDMFIDLQWVNKISFYLDRFKDKSTVSKNLYNARCPACGDSKKKKRIARLYIYEKKGNLNVDCKNCDLGCSFYNFMKEFFPQYFDEYKKDLIKAKFKYGTKTKYERKEKEPSLKNDKLVKELKGCVPILELPEDHEAVLYLKNRKFTEKELARLFYSENFYKTAEHVSFQPLAENFPKEPRIVIPFYSKEGNIEVIQGRSLKKNSDLKYLTIKAIEDVDKVFGKETIDSNRTVYCVEGPIDSLFLDNCLATCDADLTKAKADVYIWDSQPHNMDVCRLMENAIEAGKSVVIWPFISHSKLDINDMIIKGVSREALMEVIKKRTFYGMRAKLEFKKWKKV